MLPEIAALVVCSHEYGHLGWDGCGHWCVSKNLLLSHFLSVSCTLLSCFAHAVKHLFLLMGDHLLLWLCGRSFKVRPMVTEQTQTYWDARICWDKLFWSGVLETQKLTICGAGRTVLKYAKVGACARDEDVHLQMCPHIQFHATHFSLGHCFLFFVFKYNLMWVG